MRDPKLDASSDLESGTPLLTRRAALRRGLFLGLGVAAVVTVPGCAGGEDDDGGDDDDD